MSRYDRPSNPNRLVLEARRRWPPLYAIYGFRLARIRPIQNLTCTSVLKSGRIPAMTTLRCLTPADVRRLAIMRQHLTAQRLPATPEGILQTVQDLGCLQLDPISVVARTHTLVLWNRIGIYDPAHLDKLLWQDRALFEYWAHEASIVLTED